MMFCDNNVRYGLLLELITLNTVLSYMDFKNLCYSKHINNIYNV